VLVEADDPNEPISDTVRGLLDGHVWLSRKLASQGHYPAVDVLESLSRLMPEVTTDEHRKAAVELRSLLSAHREHEDLLSIGAYRRGSNPTVDTAVELLDPINTYLRQDVNEQATVETARRGLLELAQIAQKTRSKAAAQQKAQMQAQRQAAAQRATAQ
jgi:flagellum-specific ATP synthase